MDQKKPKPSKRLDLQGIRALAIIVVLGFHFFPEYCPNGYLGVDQFFVLSGFLMCMLLKRAETESPCSLVSLFYSKRFKRILPLYLLIIFISMICLYNFFPDTAIETNQESATHALLFVSNRPKTVQEDYFQMLSIAVDIFTHTWSLSVEIQFYFLVPFIFLLVKRIPERFQYIYYGVVSILSFTFFYASPATVAFNSVFARIWQFLIGMVVYLISISKPQNSYQEILNEEEEKQLLVDEESQEIECCPNNKLEYFIQPAAYFSLASLFIITLYPSTLPATLVRPLVTFGTGFLMLISDENLILSNKLLTYIGDISYSLYLIHWPIYAYWKLTCDGNKYLLVTALIASVILAIITFETFEKWYLKLSSTNIGMMVVILFFLNVGVIKKDDILDRIHSIGRNVTSLDGVTDDMTTDDAIRLNSRWSVNDMKNLYSPTCVYESVDTALGWCRHSGLSESGKYKLAIIGNSWTANHATMFYQECGYKAKSILQGSATGCEALYPSFSHKVSQQHVCRKNLTDFVEYVESEKPDYAFLISRYMSIGGPFPKNMKSFDDDPTYQIMKGQMMKFIPNVKHKIFLLDAFPEINRKMVSQIGSLIKNGTDPVDIDRILVPTHQSTYEMARKRYAQLVKDYGEKCVMVDYVPEFYKESSKTFRLFDKKGFSYFTTPSHLSPHGIEKVRHIWKDICRKL